MLPQVLSGGQGALAQLGYNFGLPTYQIGLFIAGLVSFNLIYGLLPTAATYKPEAQQAIKSEVGPIQDPKITIFNIKKFFGVTDWGFTPQNELFAGRMAQLGFAASLLGELATGLGPLGQLSAGELQTVITKLLYTSHPRALLLGCEGHVILQQVAVLGEATGNTVLHIAALPHYSILCVLLLKVEVC